MGKNMLIAQSGGPTAAVNASLAGAVRRALACREIGAVYGARNGIEGVLGEKLLPLGERLRSEEQLAALAATPAMALGSCRRRLGENGDEEEYARLGELFRKYEIGYFFYIGGNDSMDTVDKLSRYFAQTGGDVRVVGIPKTIDNDICRTDHTPGFGSAARYIANTLVDVAFDSEIYDLTSMTLVEIMGRNAGWLTAAAALAQGPGLGAPQIVCMPEIPFEDDVFLRRVEELKREHQHLIIAVSEGIRYPDGRYVAAAPNADPFGHRQLAGAARRLGFLLLERFGCKVRSIELNVLQRASAHLASGTDRAEAEAVGACAVDLALAGRTGVMATLERVSNAPYTVRCGCAPIGQVANLEKTVPVEWIDREKLGIRQELRDYLAPLIRSADQKDSGLPDYFTLA